MSTTKVQFYIKKKNYIFFFQISLSVYFKTKQIKIITIFKEAI